MTHYLFFRRKTGKKKKKGGFKSDFVFNSVFLNRKEDGNYSKMLIDVFNVTLQRHYSFLYTKTRFSFQFYLKVKID